jgi:hypothetical protein
MECSPVVNRYLSANLTNMHLFSQFLPGFAGGNSAEKVANGSNAA